MTNAMNNIRGNRYYSLKSLSCRLQCISKSLNSVRLNAHQKLFQRLNRTCSFRPISQATQTGLSTNKATEISGVFVNQSVKKLTNEGQLYQMPVCFLENQKLVSRFSLMQTGSRKMNSSILNESLLVNPLANTYIPKCIDSSSLLSSKLSLKNPVTLTGKEQNILAYSDMQGPKRTQPKFPEKASEEQLEKVFEVLSYRLPDFFVLPHDWRIYHQDVVFYNNIKGVVTHGLSAYMKHIALLKLFANLRYARIKMEILKITKHPEDGTIRVRWRTSGYSGFRVFFMFWKIKLWKWNETIINESDWVDGFSTFYVGSDGLIYKHICDKMMPDDNQQVIKSSTDGLKLAFLLGLAPSGALTNASLFNG